MNMIFDAKSTKSLQLQVGMATKDLSSFVRVMGASSST